MYSNTKSKYKYKEINLSTVLLFQCFPVFFNIYCTIQASFEVKRNHDLKWVHLIVNISVIFIKTSLLNKTPQVPRLPKCTSSAGVHKCLSAFSALRVPECLKCCSDRVPWVPECPWCILGVSLECPSSIAQVSLQCPLSAQKKSAALLEMDSLIAL